jgi:hypothetical protein
MPLPKPKAGEKQRDFVSRCIEFETNASPGRPAEQVQAMCFQAWRDRGKKKEELTMKPTNGKARLVEQVNFTGVQFAEAADGSPRMIKGVALLGGVARRKDSQYTYPVRTMESAVNKGLYEGCRCFINHPGVMEMGAGSRDLMKLAGVCRNTRVEEGKVKGDIHLLPDECGNKFFNIAQMMPEAASCSHIADGTLKKEGKSQFVEEIKEVLSVDLVVQGATTQNVFESKDTKPKGQEMEYSDIVLDDLRIKRPDLVKTLLEEGQKSRDDEVQKLTEETKDLKVKVDEFTVKDAQAQRKGAVAKLLAESKLPDAAKTDLFAEQLECISGEDFEGQAKKLIEDRMTLLGGVKNMGPGPDDKKGTEHKGSAPLAEAYSAFAATGYQHSQRHRKG